MDFFLKELDWGLNLLEDEVFGSGLSQLESSSDILQTIVVRLTDLQSTASHVQGYFPIEEYA